MGRTWEWKNDEGDELTVEYRPGGTLSVVAHSPRGRQVGGDTFEWLEDGDREGEVYAEVTELPYAALKELMTAMAEFRRRDLTVQPAALTATSRTVLKEMRRTDPAPVYSSGVCRTLGIPLGSISLAVRQLTGSGLIAGRWETEAERGDTHRPFRKYYELTEAGRVYKFGQAG